MSQLPRNGVIRFVRNGEEFPVIREWRCPHRHRDNFSAFECAVREARSVFLRAGHGDRSPNTTFAAVTVTTAATRPPGNPD